MEASRHYTTGGLLSQSTDFEGNVTKYSWDSARKLQTSRTEGYGTPEARTINTTWDAVFRLPKTVSVHGRETEYDYNADGYLVGTTITDTNSNRRRTWTYSNLTAWGQPSTLDGPRTDVEDVTQITWHPVSASSPNSGQRHTVTNALGHVTTYDAYDGNGQPIQITDSNGIIMTLEYWPRGWLKRMQIGSEITDLTYWPTGLLKQLGLPNGTVLDYTYDAARHLTDVEDQLGNRIHYTLDAMGNATQTDVYDASDTLVQTQQRVFDSLNRLWKVIGAYPGEITVFGYDDNGNPTSITDPLSRVTEQSYDALNRLTSTTDPGNGVTHFDLNALDQLSGVEDPRGLETQYGVDALDNQNQLVSPDTGITGSVYDEAGNLISKTDAKNQTTTYTYDALNRLTQVTYADASTVTFTWDQNDSAHGYGIGRLTRMVDASGSTDWKYDAHGRVILKTVVNGSVTLTMAYGYDETTGQLRSMTLPSGKVINYVWTNGQITAVRRASSTIMSSITYHPFGGPKEWTFANGQTVGRAIDLNGRIISDPVDTDIAYDAAGRITGYASGILSALIGSHSVGYDDLDRVTDYTGPSGVLAYLYDANGNRTRRTINGVTTTFSVAATSNRLTKIGSTTILYDANGSRSEYGGGRSYGYDAAGRLTNYVTGTNAATYLYNGRGERVRKTVNGTATLFMYDEAGHLVGEYNATGSVIRETVFLTDMPVATFKNNNTAYYVLADWRNTPRQITNGAGLAVWAWNPRPFGDTAAASGTALGLSTTFTYNHRFPGQYYDSESGTFYNYYRDYEPASGRYLQSDPIGLGGGINTYAYAVGNPISRTDPTGLVTWQGTGAFFSAIAGGGAAFGAFQLKSECVNGFQQLAQVYAAGPAVGVGLQLTGSGSTFTFEDGRSTPDATVFNGQFLMAWAGGAAGLGYGVSSIQLGEARAPLSHGYSAGVDMSVGGTAGRSWVGFSISLSCGCESGGGK
jgi:RHS repeat-associated protein